MILRVLRHSIGPGLLVFCGVLWTAPALAPPLGSRPAAKPQPAGREVVKLAPLKPAPARVSSPSGGVAITVQVIGSGPPPRYDTFLAQNTPNSFGSSTVIRYGLSRPSNLSIVVYAITGRRVATLATGYQNAGTFSLWWDGRGDDGRRVPNGVYLYRMTTDMRSTSRKMIVMW